MILPPIPQWSPVRITWQDSTGADPGWHELLDSEKEVVGCISVGMVESQEADRITLVLSRETVHGQIDSAITIPTCSVTSWKVLEAG